jgi:hypothetical protein
VIAFYVNPFHRRWIIARLRAPSKLIAFACRLGRDVGVEIERGLRAWSPELVEQVRGWLAQVQYVPDEFRARLVGEAREIFYERQERFVITHENSAPPSTIEPAKCERCYGRGYRNDSDGSEVDGTFDFVEVYCDCTAGDRLRAADERPRCTDCGGGTCLCEQLATGHA